MGTSASPREMRERETEEGRLKGDDGLISAAVLVLFAFRGDAAACTADRCLPSSSAVNCNQDCGSIACQCS